MSVPAGAAAWLQSARGQQGTLHLELVGVCY